MRKKEVPEQDQRLRSLQTYVAFFLICHFVLDLIQIASSLSPGMSINEGNGGFAIPHTAWTAMTLFLSALGVFSIYTAYRQPLEHILGQLQVFQAFLWITVVVNVTHISLLVVETVSAKSTLYVESFKYLIGLYFILAAYVGVELILGLYYVRQLVKTIKSFERASKPSP